jgi:acyl-CoA-binding protein
MWTAATGVVCDDRGIGERLPMSDLDTRFATAVDDVKQLPERPDNATLLKLYALYKQGSAGEVSGKRPGMMAFVDRAKYDAWAELAGTPQADAKQAYIDLVEELKTG